MKAYHQVSALLFEIVGVMHLVRAVLGWPMTIGEIEVPVAASYAVFALCSGMTVWALSSMKKA